MLRVVLPVLTDNLPAVSHSLHTFHREVGRYLAGVPANTTEFPPTHWTLIVASSGPQRNVALARLYEIYWAPLCAQAQRFGVPPDETEDAVQEFLLGLFDSSSFDRADPAAGRFRSYLIGALRNQLSHRRAKLHAQKRGGGQIAVPLDDVSLTDSSADERQFDADWAQALIRETMRRFLSEHSGDPLCAQAVGDEETSLAEHAVQLGITPAAVKSRVFRLRQRFRQIVREEVSRTIADPGQLDDEVRYLCAVLGKTEGVNVPIP
jgi:RNA polymerase sigma factor (sigma-70 family)